MAVPNKVLNPTMMRSSLYFAEACADSVAESVLERGLESRTPEVLELGCGAGLASLLAAKAGANVTALDRDIRAVAATQLNAARNGLNVRALASSWDQALGSTHRFDRVLLNPPFLQQQLRNETDQWLTRAFVSGPQHEQLQAATQGCRAATSTWRACHLAHFRTLRRGLGRLANYRRRPSSYGQP